MKRKCTALGTKTSLGMHLQLVQATAERVRGHMDAPIGNMAPTSAAEELYRQKDSRLQHQRLEHFRRSDDAHGRVEQR